MSYEVGLQSNQLKDFSVTIDGIQLTNSQVHSLKMKWNIDNFKITGSLIFTDFTDMVENVPLRGNNTVVMTMTDFDDKVSKQEFKVTDVAYTRTQSGEPSVQLMMIDPVTLSATQMFNEMSWKEADLIEIIDHAETLKPLLSPKKSDFSSGNPKHKNFVMPLHVPFNVVMHWLAKNNNMMLFQTRTDNVIQPLSKLFSRGKKGDKFHYKSPNNLYRRKIYEFRASFGKTIEANVFQSTAKVASFDINNKHSKYTDEDFKGALGKIGSTGTTDLDLPATGSKHFYKSDYHVKEATEFMWQKNSYKGLTVEMLVPGSFDTNIGDVVELDLVNFTKPTSQESNINGLWLISEIIDNITPPDFTQRITLSRAKFSK